METKKESPTKIPSLVLFKQFSSSWHEYQEEIDLKFNNLTYIYLPEFNNLTYPQYFEKYSITPLSPVSTSYKIYHDNLSNYIV